MSELNLYKTETIADDGTSVRLVFDEDADILEIFFGENEPATGVELTDQIILRFNRKMKRAISLTLLDFSVLTEHTEYGPRSYSLSAIDDLPEDIRELIPKLITSMPVNQFLKISYFQASTTKRVMLVYVECQHKMVAT